MSNFGKRTEIKKMIDDDGMYLTLGEFKNTLEFVISSLVFGNLSLNMIKANDYVASLSLSSLENLKQRIINMENINFTELGFAYSENGEEAIVSPDFVLLQTFEQVKKDPKKIAALYELLVNKVGKDNLSNIDFKRVYEELKKEKQTKSKETEGLYRLDFDYSIEYLRGIEVSYKLVSVIDEFISDILDYFTSDFDEYSDPEYLKVKDKIDAMYEDISQEKYYEIQEKVWKIQDLAKEDAIKRYREKLFNNQKIAVAELVRLLIDKLKSNIIGYDYEESLTRRGYLTELGLDEVLYYAHPIDKYDHYRQKYSVENPCSQDYDEYYFEKEENEEENDNEVTVVRKIYM